MIDLLSLILNFLLGSGLAATLIFYRAKRRQENAEASTAEQSTESVAIANMRESAVEWKQIAEARETKLTRKDELIDRLYTEKANDRATIHELTTRNNQLEIDLTVAKFKACNVRLCANREPQTGF